MSKIVVLEAVCGGGRQHGVEAVTASVAGACVALHDRAQDRRLCGLQVRAGVAQATQCQPAADTHLQQTGLVSN